MQAILTKVMPTTNTKPMRIMAKCSSGKLTISWDYDRSADDNHKAAAHALMRQVWPLMDSRLMATGVLHDGHYAHVIVKTGGAHSTWLSAAWSQTPKKV